MPLPRIEFGLREPEEALNFFRQKGYLIAFDHRDVWRQANQAGFTVAKVTQVDLLMDFRAHLDAAIQNGTTKEQFIKDIRPNLMKRGWWGRAAMTDPKTRETKVVQLGSPRRLKVIYDTNLRTSHSEGQWQRIQDTKDVLPFLMYDHTPSAHERPEHASWDGLILRADHDWWKSHSPIRAWGCKCGLHQLSTDQAAQLGGESAAPTETYRQYTNKRTGETIQVPDGVDPEFAYPPGGRLDNLGKMLADRVERAPASLGAAVWEGAKERVSPVLTSEFTNWIAALESNQSARFGSRRVVGALSGNAVSNVAAMVGIELASAAISINQSEVRHLISSWRKGDKALPRDWIYALPEKLKLPRAVLHDAQSGNLLYVWKMADGRYIRVVVRPNFRIHKETFTNAVRSGQVVDLNDLNGPTFTLLDGAL